MKQFALSPFIFILSTGAAAQAVDPRQDVADRPHPEYAQVGVQAAGFTLLPSVTAKVSATDNYYATDHARQANAALLLRPDLTWRSNWGRHRVDGDAFLEQRLNHPVKRDNSLSYGARVSGTLDISQTSQARIGVVAERLVEDRTNLGSFRASIKPVHFTNLQANADYSKLFGNVQLDVRAGLNRIVYGDAVLPGNVVVDQGYRNYTRFDAGIRGKYDLQNGVSLVGNIQHSTINYDFGPDSAHFIDGVSLDRDSSGTTIQGGVDLELSNLIFGTLEVGYLERKYRDPRLRDVSGLSYNAALSWNVTALTTLVLSGRRYVDESSSVTIAGNLRTNVSLAVHHELYRHVLLLGETNFATFKAIGGGQAEANGHEFLASIGARYLVSRRATLNGSFQYSSRQANLSVLSYHAVQANLSFRYGF